MSQNILRSVSGKDSAGNFAYVSVCKENRKILLFSSEGSGEIVFTKAQARELVKKIEECIKE